MATDRDAANEIAFRRMCEAEPVLVDVRPAIDVVPGMTSDLILTSGPQIPFEQYTGGQRKAVVYGALYEGLADDYETAEALFAKGELRVGACHDYGCVGSVAGIYTASMPVFVVENKKHGNTGFCNFYEGESRKRLNYGFYDDDVRDQLRRIETEIAPIIGEAVRQAGGIPLKPLMKRALHMGDELHSRNTAATLLFGRELFKHLLKLSEGRHHEINEVLDFLSTSDYFFLRISMAASKAIADAARGVEGSSIVTAMTIYCSGYGVRVSGLGDEWFLGPFPTVQARLFEGFTEDDIEWIGGESLITETVGLGGFSQAAAFALQSYQGGSPQAMIENNEAMYQIVAGENTDFKIPYFGYRGSPTGIDVLKVRETGITPVLDAGLAGRDGGQIGAGVVRAPVECFQAAADAFERRYGPASG
jgi:hypothetical protein